MTINSFRIQSLSAVPSLLNMLLYHVFYFNSQNGISKIASYITFTYKYIEEKTYPDK